MNNYEKFKRLHQQESPLLLGNVWNVSSAQCFAANGFEAIGTSSAAVANSLGYADDGKMPFNELLFIVKRIIANITIPLTVDIESGYGQTPAQIAENIKQLHDIGAAGINIEDSVVNNDRRLLRQADFAAALADIRSALSRNNINIFMNVRTDAFLLDVPSKLEETLSRIDAYQQAGADGLFIPCIEKETDIEKIVTSAALPVNVMCMPNLPSYRRLAKLGVKRVSMGNFLYDAAVKDLTHNIQDILKDGSFNSLFPK